MTTTLCEMAEKQLCKWPLARDNYAALDRLEEKRFNVAIPKPGNNACAGMEVAVLFNPARAVSTLAATDAAAISERPCFLCSSNRPAKQMYLPLAAASGNEYLILLNPYPIFRRHFTVPAAGHCPQRIAGRFADMLELADRYGDMVVLYNGPECGASAPDHFHFQMGEKGFLPLERNFGKLRREKVLMISEASVSLLRDYVEGIPVIESPDAVSACLAFEKVVRTLLPGTMYGERMMNILCWKDNGIFRIVVFPRKAHRPSCYFLGEGERLRISPGTVDLAGVFIVPTKEDFGRADARSIEGILKEVLYTDWQPAIEVGLLSSAAVEVAFQGKFLENGGEEVFGEEQFRYADGKVQWRGRLYDSIEFAPAGGQEDSRFTVKDVIIGIDFHWERKENQIFGGGLKILPSEGKLVTINIIGVEDYLLSVISSEMNENAPEEFLKAHAVISRSWLLARPTLSGLKSGAAGCQPDSMEQDGTLRHIRWYDRDDHSLFDVCADDHCQRYQGLGRVTGEKVRRVIEATRGQVLKYGDGICDARFSKCCGGVTELFPTCWGDEEAPYLQAFRDADEALSGQAAGTVPDGGSLPEPGDDFCNTSDRALLATVLNDYDCETADFYRWEVTYSQAELSELIRRKSGMDFGNIVALEPLRRGPSGRIYELRIVGTKLTAIVGKELEIRKFLSESHLYSSAFEVLPSYSDSEQTAGHCSLAGDDGEPAATSGAARPIPASFTLKGAGWGHGVGLCQIGAAVMGSRGYTYERILYHYYKGTKIEKLY